jgi:hypothetical protein
LVNAKLYYRTYDSFGFVYVDVKNDKFEYLSLSLSLFALLSSSPPLLFVRFYNFLFSKEHAKHHLTKLPAVAVHCVQKD